MLSRENIGRALVAIFEVSRGHTVLAAYRKHCAARLGDVLGHRTLVGTLDAYAETISVVDSEQNSFELPFDSSTPLGEVARIPASADALSAGRALAVSAVLGERVGAFLGIAFEEGEELDGGALIDLAFQLTLAMEVILERAEAYREAEVMANEARAKAELLATVSHEIRTPLNAIINLPERIRREFENGFSGNEDVVLRSVGMLERSGSHLLNLVNDILDVSRIDAGEMRLRPGETSARQALEDAIASCQTLAEQRAIRIDVECDDSAGVLLADPLRLTQILTNLVTNGVKYSRERSRVTVRALDAGDRVCFSVEDRGIGIGLKDQERIFERYIRLQSDPSDQESSGSGLGLHITRKLVELHEGSIWVESELGRGSTFHVELPRRARSLEMLTDMHQPPLPPPTTGQDHTILLVDDDAMVLETAELLLEELGHALVCTTDVQRIDELIQNHRPSLMLLDVSMNGVNGLEVLKRLRHDFDEYQLPVLVSSGHPLEARDLEALGAGWLPKPWRRVDLLEAVSRRLRHTENPTQGPTRTS